MILSCMGPDPTWKASDYYNYATQMPEAGRQRHGTRPTGLRTYK